MKRTLFIILIVVFITNTIQAQNPYFGVKAGFNMSHAWHKDKFQKFTGNYSLLPGYNGGLTMEYRIIPELSLSANILVTTKGYLEKDKTEFQGETIKFTDRHNLYYFELPIYAKYEFEIMDVKYFAGLGPFVGYGYWGKINWKREGGGDIESGTEDVYWGIEPDSHDYKEWDFGAGAVAGIKYLNLLFEAGYHFSITNSKPQNEFEPVFRNGVAFVSVSFFFSKFYKYSEAYY